MKTLRKTPISLAVAASLGMAVTAFDAGAVNLATDGIGEVAIAPYYTTRNGWMTLLNLTNTRNIPVVVKVRLHEGHNTRDVLDFNVALSRNDMWAAVIQEKDGKPTLTMADNSCIIGDVSTEKPLNAVGAGGDVDRLREGYVEVIVLGYANIDHPDINNTGTPIDVGYAIENGQCDRVRQAFRSQDILATAQQFGEPINAVKFNFRLINSKKGIEAGGQAVTWANFFNHLANPAAGGVADGPLQDYPDGGATPITNAACAVHRGHERIEAPQGADWDPTTDNTNAATFACRNLITAQEPDAFLEPSLNDVFPRVGQVYDDQTNQLWTTNQALLVAQGLTVPRFNDTGNGEARGVDVFSATIQRAGIINEWVAAVNEGDTEAEWVVTFPTKSFYVDQARDAHAAVGDRNDPPANGRWETRYFAEGAVPADPANPPDPLYEQVSYPPFSEEYTAGNGSCSRVNATLYDREENSVTSDLVDSPSLTVVNRLCYETNVLKFSEDSKILGSKLAKMVDTSKLSQKKGWLTLGLTRETQAQTGLPMQDVDANVQASQGLPAIGFMIKNRDRGNPEINYMSTITHAYRRQFAPWVRWN